MYYLGIELSWSVYSLVFLPFAIGMLAALVLEADIYRDIPKPRLVIIAAMYFAGLCGIGFSVWEDAQGIPPPYYITAASNGGAGLQEHAIETDRCLRKEDECSPALNRAMLLNRVPTCLAEYPNVPELKLSPALSKSYTDARLAYYCEVLDSLKKHFGVKPSFVWYVALLMNFISIGFVWTFVIFSISMFSFYPKRIVPAALHILIGCFAILLLWFPFRLYAQWQLWYGNVIHVQTEYPAFWVLLLVSFMLLIMFTIWILILQTNFRSSAVFSGVWSVVAAVLGALVGFEPQLLDKAFLVASTVPTAMLMVAVLVIMTFVASYAYILLTELTRQPST